MRLQSSLWSTQRIRPSRKPKVFANAFTLHANSFSQPRKQLCFVVSVPLLQQISFKHQCTLTKTIDQLTVSQTVNQLCSRILHSLRDLTLALQNEEIRRIPELTGRIWESCKSAQDIPTSNLISFQRNTLQVRAIESHEIKFWLVLCSSDFNDARRFNKGVE